MRIWENLRVSARYLRVRFLESALAVLGTTLGVAVIATAAALVQATERMAAVELSGPMYRMIDVVPQAATRRADVPVTRLGEEGADTPQLSLSDLDGVRADCDAVDYALAMMREQAQVGDIKGTFGSVTSAGSGGLSLSGAGGAKQTAYFMTSTTEGPGPAGKGGVMKASPGAPAGAPPAGAVPKAPALEATLTPLIDRFDLVRATQDVFAVYGLTPAKGSLFSDADGKRGNAVAVLGADIAKQMFGDKDIVGGTFKANGIVYTILGVLEPAASTRGGKDNPNTMVFAPYQQPSISMGGNLLLPPMKVGNLTMAVKDTTTLKAAISQVESYFTRRYGENAFTVRSSYLEALAVKTDFERLFVVIGFLAGAALLISSINLFNMLTIRAARRTRGTGVMRSFGANRTDVFSIFLGESVMISAIGGIVGVVIAPFFFKLLFALLIPPDFPQTAGSMAADWRVLLVTLLGALALNTVFAAFPAWRASTAKIVDAIKAD